MPDSKRFLHPEAITRISRLELRARHIVEGFLSGMHRSPYFGQSVEFLQHREYTAGDDLRHIDWKVWAKQDRYYVKQFEEDTNLRATLLVDVSGSMQYGSGPLNKYEYGCTIAAQPGLPAAAAAGRGRLRGVRRGDSRDQVPLRSQAQPSELDHPGAGGQRAARQDRPAARSSASVAETYPRRGMMVLISDLLVDRAGLFKGLQAAAAARARRDGVSRHGRRRARFSVQRPDAVRGAGIARPFDLQSAGAARRLPGSAARLSRRSPPRLHDEHLRLRAVRTSQPMDAVLAHYLATDRK